MANGKFSRVTVDNPVSEANKERRALEVLEESVDGTEGQAQRETPVSPVLLEDWANVVLKVVKVGEDFLEPAEIQVRQEKTVLLVHLGNEGLQYAALIY